LVVAADADAASCYVALLKVAGHSARTAADSRAAAVQAADLSPDVAVIDLHPSRYGGLVEALTSNRPHGRRPLMVAISNCLPVEANGWLQDGGFDVCLSKPVDPEALIGLLLGFKRVLAPNQADDACVADVPSAIRGSERRVVPN
jgi:CheY-like chemotaxis protein